MYNSYAYNLDKPLSLEGIRQIFKFWHAYATIPKVKNPKILDIGCGFGQYGNMLKQNNFQCEYTAMDIEKRFVITDETFPKKSKFIMTDLTRDGLSLAGRCKYDQIVILDSLQNVDKQSGIAIVKSLSQILSDPGIVCISTRNAMMEPDTDKNSHLYRWDIRELMSDIINSGLTIREIYGINQGVDEASVIPQETRIYSFLPARVFRVISGLDEWETCKYVMIDCGKLK